MTLTLLAFCAAYQEECLVGEWSETCRLSTEGRLQFGHGGSAACGEPWAVLTIPKMPSFIQIQCSRKHLPQLVL